MHVGAGEHAPCLAWLAKPLKCCYFGFCGLIERKFSVNGPYNTMEFEAFLWALMQRRAHPPWSG